MAKLESLVASVSKSEEKVEKINNTIERHFKQLEKKSKLLTLEGYNMDYSNVDFKVKLSTHFNKEIAHIENQKWGTDGKSVSAYWELCDLCRKLQDIHGSYKKLADAEETLSNWKIKVVTEQTKVDFAASAPKVIIDFVNHWGELAFKWMMQNTNYPNAERIEKIVENDKQIKIIQLTMRVTDVVGTITDASHLSVGEKGDLTGIIEGEKGRAMVETISAGGYNIQCFHYRTLVNKL